MHADIEATTRPTIKVILEDAGGNWSAYAPAVPGVAGIGATAELARQSLEEALTIHFDELHADELKETHVATQ
jgi:predicted RNase H-like HicB family nuclease